VIHMASTTQVGTNRPESNDSKSNVLQTNFKIKLRGSLILNEC
jgi:hypothetical protein